MAKSALHLLKLQSRVCVILSLTIICVGFNGIFPFLIDALTKIAQPIYSAQVGFQVMELPRWIAHLRLFMQVVELRPHHACMLVSTSSLLSRKCFLAFFAASALNSQFGFLCTC